MTQTVLLGDILKKGDITIHNKLRAPLNSRQRSEMSGVFPYYGATGQMDSINKYKFDGFYVLVAEDGTVYGSNGVCPMIQRIRGKFWVSNHAHVLQGKDEVDTKYLALALEAADVRPHITGAVQLKLSKDNLLKMKVSWPERKEREAILDCIDPVDEKIELNRKMNKTLEEMGQALFRHYFIHNDEAKMWKNVPISELCVKVASGGTPPTKRDDYYGGDVQWYSTKELRDGFLLGSDKTITAEGLSNSAAKLFPENTVMMAIYAAPTVGRLGILTSEASFNQATCGLVAKSEIGYEFIYLYLLLSRAELNNMANGAAQQNISVGKVRDFKVMHPDDASIASFRQNIEPIFSQIRNNSEHIQTLTALRDSLLPRLISGKIKL